MQLASCTCACAHSFHNGGVALTKQPSRRPLKQHGCAQKSHHYQNHERKKQSDDCGEVHQTCDSGMKPWDFGSSFGVQSCWQRAIAGVAVGLHLAIGSLIVPDNALALLNAPKAVLPRTAEAALRRSIPASNESLSQVQSYMEEIQFALRIPQRKPWGTMTKNIQSALELTADVPGMVRGVPSAKADEAMDLINQINKGLYRTDTAIGQRDQQKVASRVAETLRSIADLELLEAPGLPYIIPREYTSLPKLAGRATAEFVVKKTDGSKPFYDQNSGNASDRTTFKIVLDGYSSPISAGNFASNIVDGIYNGQEVKADRTALAAGAGLYPGRTIPLEILPAGDFEPLYRTPIDVQSGERPVLPLSILGAVSMAKSQQSDYAAAGDEFFVYKFNRAEAGLAGMSFDEGSFGVFGYVVDGLGELEKLTSGDVIVSAKLINGADRLQRSDP